MKKILTVILMTALLLVCASGFLSCGENGGPETSGSAPGESTSGTVPDDTGSPASSDSSAVTDPPVTDPPVTDAPKPEKKTVSFIACGDNIVHDAVREDAKNRADGDNPGYNFYDMYRGVADIISSADISFINMEGCVEVSGAPYLGYPDFNAPKEIAHTFVKLGFDVVNLANNHMLDYGERGYADTIATFSTLPVMTIGGYKKSNYDDPRILEVNGVKIAFLSYTTLVNWAHADSIPYGSDYLIPYAEDEVITRQVNAVRDKADFVVVSMHWGDEDAFQPNARQKQLAALCADLGVDVIVGHHSHTVQPCGWIDRKDGGRMFVTYSLGNFISTMHYSQNMASVMLSLDFAVYPDGRKAVENACVIPTVCHYSLNRDALQLYRMSNYSEELAMTHGSTKMNAFSYAILRKYITDNIPEEFIKW